MVNPTKGYIASANNFITSANVKHGISHSFAFQHRSIRIGELIDAIKAERKLTVDDMKKIALDTVDI